MSSRHQKSSRNAPQNYVISRPNPVSVILRMDVPPPKKKEKKNYVTSRPNPISVVLRMDVLLIRKTSVSNFYGEA